MHYQLTHFRPSFTLFVKAWLAEHLNRFQGGIFKWIVSDLIKSFEKRRLIYKTKIDQIPNLSIESAQFKLLLINDLLKSYEKLDLSVSEVNVVEVQKSFKNLKSTFYTYEAKLRIHVNENLIPTPTSELLLENISVLSKRALLKSILK